MVHELFTHVYGERKMAEYTYRVVGVAVDSSGNEKSVPDHLATRFYLELKADGVWHSMVGWADNPRGEFASRAHAENFANWRGWVQYEETPVDEALAQAGVSSLGELTVDHYEQCEDSLIKLVDELYAPVWDGLIKSVPLTDAQRKQVDLVLAIARQAKVRTIMGENCY